MLFRVERSATLFMGETLSQPWGSLPNQPYGTYLMQPAPVKRNNTIGLIALIASIIGFVFACIPGALVVGWVLLPIALILGIVGVCQSGMSKGTSIAAIIVSILGIVVGVVVFFAVVGNAFSDASNKPNLTATSAAPGAQATTSTRASSSNEQGSRENPFPIETPVTSPEWQITLGPPQEAGLQIAAENQFNDPPEAGMNSG